MRNNTHLATGLILMAGLVFSPGCTRFRAAFGKAQHKTEVATRAVDKDTQQFATAVVDVLSMVDLPTNSLPDLRNAMTIGLRYARFTQRGLGLPIARIDVEGEVKGEKKAVEAARKIEATSAVHLETEATVSREELGRLKRLAELGAVYEKEKNKNIVKRVWQWSIATFGIGGLIALCIFCPVVIPILGRILGWIVSALPKLAGLLGVVSTKAFDKVVGSVEIAKRKNQATKFTIEDTASRKMDDNDKQLVRARKPIVMEKMAEDEEEKAETDARVERAVEETEETARKRMGAIGGAAATDPIGRPL